MRERERERERPHPFFHCFSSSHWFPFFFFLIIFVAHAFVGLGLGLGIRLDLGLGWERPSDGGRGLGRRGSIPLSRGGLTVPERVFVSSETKTRAIVGRAVWDTGRFY